MKSIMETTFWGCLIIMYHSMCLASNSPLRSGPKQIDLNPIANQMARAASREYGWSQNQRLLLFNFLTPLLSPSTKDDFRKSNCMSLKTSKPYVRVLQRFVQNNDQDPLILKTTNSTSTNPEVPDSNLPELEDILFRSRDLWNALLQATGSPESARSLYLEISTGDRKRLKRGINELGKSILRLKSDIRTVLRTGDFRELENAPLLPPLVHQILIEEISRSMRTVILCDPDLSDEVPYFQGELATRIDEFAFEPPSKIDELAQLLSGNFRDTRTVREIKRYADRHRIFVNALSLYLSSMSSHLKQLNSNIQHNWIGLYPEIWMPFFDQLIAEVSISSQNHSSRTGILIDNWQRIQDQSIFQASHDNSMDSTRRVFWILRNMAYQE
jgi:hypothetical protein